MHLFGVIHTENHILCKHSVASVYLIYKNVGYCANKLAVLHYGAAAHSLHNAARKT